MRLRRSCTVTTLIRVIWAEGHRPLEFCWALRAGSFSFSFRATIAILATPVPASTHACAQTTLVLAWAVIGLRGGDGKNIRLAPLQLKKTKKFWGGRETFTQILHAWGVLNVVALATFDLATARAGASRGLGACRR